MQKAEIQHKHTQSQPAVQQSKGASFESPQGEQIAQFESMAESSTQAGRLAQLATTANSGSMVVAQRRLIDDIHNSPRVTAQRQQLNSISGDAAQREEAEESLQAKVAQREAAPAKPNNTGLPDNLKSGIESLSGMSMDNVRVHYNSSQPAQLNALAYAQGSDIHVAPGQEQHLPHEAWHVVQQAQGRVKPTMQMKEGVPVNDDHSLEHEADVMGAKAVSGAVVAVSDRVGIERAANQPSIQRMVGTELGIGTEVHVEGFNPGYPFKAFIRARFDQGSGQYKVQILRLLGGSGFQNMGDIECLPNILNIVAGGEDEAVDEVESEEDDDSAILGVMVTQTDDSDHGPDMGGDTDELLADWSEVEDADDELLFRVFVNLAYHHYSRVGRGGDRPSESNLQQPFETWKGGGVMTRSRFKELIGLSPAFGDDVDNIIQMARTPNTYSYNTDYAGTSNGFAYKNVVYLLDGQGSIDFKTNPASILAGYNKSSGGKLKSSDVKWQYPVADASEVQMNKNSKDKEYGIMPSGTKVLLKKASRTQHFAIADKLYPNSRGGTWTWHHLTSRYKMILVDMRVHQKHGHNGGVHLWK